MHLYLLVKGIKDHQDRWVNDLLAKHLPYKNKNLPQVSGGYLCQLAVRPVMLYEIGFPEDQLDEVLKTVRPSGYKNTFMEKAIHMIGKLLGLKPIPKFTADDGVFRVRNEAVGVIGVGLKKDRFVDGVEQL